MREGCPMARTDDNIGAVRLTIKTDKRVGYQLIRTSLGIGMSQMHKILHEYLAVRKLCTRKRSRSRIPLHQDNASYVPLDTTNNLETLGIVILTYLPYSPDLAPYIFPEIKEKHLGKWLTDAEEAGAAYESPSKRSLSGGGDTRYGTEIRVRDHNRERDCGQSGAKARRFVIKQFSDNAQRNLENERGDICPDFGVGLRADAAACALKTMEVFFLERRPFSFELISAVRTAWRGTREIFRFVHLT
ncbi:hypothetical protein EVAR_79124_1 [Eumeta japonica]|uniref:Histone-lysine N-methyltransferase SETMAR n=1 Tax=Eumeta variegata TaxID=151549 RepID=A0A4C1UT04_EUMVA|nr:hypothetical protein EVAR_79124_1 [Eumeta japonica]